MNVSRRLLATWHCTKDNIMSMSCMGLMPVFFSVSGYMFIDFDLLYSTN